MSAGEQNDSPELPAKKTMEERQLELIQELAPQAMALYEKQLDVQRHELEVGKEIALAEQETQRRAIEADVQDTRYAFDWLRWVSVILPVTLIAILLICAWAGELKLAIELVKAIGFILIGTFGGYQWGRRQSDDD